MALVTDLTARRLEARLATEQREGRLPSVVAALARDGSLVWRGYRGETTGEPGLRPHDLQYRIGSITKTMTAVLVMQLREDGSLALADPLATYLPEVGEAFGDRTLRALLSHSAGVPNEPPGEWWERVDGVSFAELAARAAKESPRFDSGETFHYSNLAYGFLGEVVARVSGRPWWECLTERVLEPLGMLRTSYDPFDPHAQGYSVAPYTSVLTPEPATDTRAMAPAGQVWSTVLDLATYADFLIAGHRDVLDESALAEMTTPHTGSEPGGLGTGYGLGLRLVPGGSGTLVGDTRTMPGFQASLFVDRGRRAGAVVLANATTGLRTDAVAPELLDVLEGCEPSPGDLWEPATSVPAEALDVVGVWHWGNTPEVVRWDGSVLHMSDAETGERLEVFALVAGEWRGVAGYHDGERPQAVTRADGSVDPLVCSTFVLTREPYGPVSEPG